MIHSQPTTLARGSVVLLLSLLLGLQPITTDLYLPALPVLRSDLSASMAQTQLTLSALLLAFGVSQLVWGPLSDRFGRKPVLLAGLGAYVVAALASAAAPDIGWLIFWRSVQGSSARGFFCGTVSVKRQTTSARLAAAKTPSASSA